jgi:cell division protease FtsH
MFPGVDSTSESTRELVDQEVRRIVEECYERACRMLGENRDRLESLTQALLERETLDEDDALQAAGFDRRPKAVDEGGKEATITEPTPAP